MIIVAMLDQSSCILTFNNSIALSRERAPIEFNSSVSIRFMLTVHTSTQAAGYLMDGTAWE